LLVPQQTARPHTANVYSYGTWEEISGRSAHMYSSPVSLDRHDCGWRHPAFRPKPDAAWTPERVAAGDFYILCPDNETMAEQDAKRIAGGATDLLENRRALSRWHSGWKDAFARFVQS